MKHATLIFCNDRIYLFKVIAQTSAGRALIYTCGHIIIAMSVVSVVTGATGIVALVEPTINGVNN